MMAISLVLTMACGAAEGRTQPPVWRPLLSRALPDPYVFEDEGYYYITGTGWHGFVGSELTRESMQSFEFSFDFGDLGGPFQLWGIKFYRDAEGAYHLYATIHFGYFVTAVAHFAPQPGHEWQPGKPIAAWTFTRILVGDPEGKTCLAYDEKMVEDEDGTLYLIYNASKAMGHNVHIYAQRMRDPATPDPTFEPRTILSPEGYRSEDRNPGFIQITEATNIAYVQGTYVLLYSVGDFAAYGGQSNYKLGVATSDVLIPPEGQSYTKVLIPDPRNLWGNDGKNGQEISYLLQSEKPAWPNYCGEVVVGPGLGNIVDVNGRYWLVFHGYLPGDDRPGPDARYTWKLPLDIDIRKDTPRCDWIKAILP